jgi:hypothetical protein
MEMVASGSASSPAAGRAAAWRSRRSGLSSSTRQLNRQRTASRQSNVARFEPIDRHQVPLATS